MIEYVAAAWLTTCSVALPNEIFCVALAPGKEFRMHKFMGGAGYFWSDGKKDRPIEDWCVRNDGDAEAWVHASYQGDKTLIRLGAGMVPCSQKAVGPSTS